MTNTYDSLSDIAVDVNVIQKTIIASYRLYPLQRAIGFASQLLMSKFRGDDKKPLQDYRSMEGKRIMFHFHLPAR